MAILERFTKQPGEIRAFDISFAGYLAAAKATGRPGDPIEFLVPDGISLISAFWVSEGGYVKLYLDGGSHRKNYKVTVWLNTSAGERLEADILIKVRDS